MAFAPRPASVRAGQVFEMVYELWKYHEGKFTASADIPVELNGPSYSEAVDVIRNTGIGRIKINGLRMELMRMDQWQCADAFDTAEEEGDRSDCIDHE